MRYSHRWGLYLVALSCGALIGCKPSPVFELPKPPSGGFTPTPTPAAAAILETEKPAIVLPPPPLLSPAGHALILEFETGGRSGYDPNPEWPGGASGVTVGIGYDCGYYSSKVILADWQALDRAPRIRLSYVSGFTGQKARAKREEVRDIFVKWELATDVFDHVDVAREFSSAKRAMPGFEDLRANAQAGIMSLGFNRGWQMSGANRVEMRAIRDLVPSRDYGGMAVQFRKMIRVWTGTSIENGMTRRRYAEANLVETP